jgi:hypothetical protein
MNVLAKPEDTMTPAVCAKSMATYLQPMAIAASWLGLAALGTGCFFAPRGAEVQPTMDDVFGFGCSMAISGAAAAVTAFAIGGRKRWALQLAISVLLLGAFAVLVLLYFLWFDTTFVRQRMDFWSFQRFQHIAASWAQQLAGYHGPLGAAAGVAFGAVTGLLIKFGRIRPRLATGTGLAFLFLFVSDFGRQFSADVVTWLGWRLRYLFVPWSISSDDISITAMIFGAITGATVAGLAMCATRSRQTPRSGSTEPFESAKGLISRSDPTG